MPSLVEEAGSRDSGRAAALGCRAHTGWAALVVVAGGLAQPEVVFRRRADLGDPAGRVRRNAYQAARSLKPAEAAVLVEAAEQIAAEQAAAALERTVREAADEGAVVRPCAVVLGTFPSGAGLSRSSRHTPSRMRRRDGSISVRCCRAASRADSTRSRSRNGRSGSRASRRSVSAETSCSIGLTSCGERSGRPGRRTRSWQRSRRGSRSRDRLDAGHASACPNPAVG